VPIEPGVLKRERDELKEELRSLEAEQRKLEAELKGLRQREIKLKREIEALSILIDVQDGDEKNGGSARKPDAGAQTDA
jgi:predicted  nucleic acid-binding Zn-ribbon protein